MQRLLASASVSLIPLVFIVAFVTMGWIRSGQGHSEHVYDSQITALALSHGPVDPLAASRLRGEKSYRHYCQTCHGEQGKGDGFNSSHLDPHPRDFTDKKFWQSTRNERVFDAISQGGAINGKSVLMPAWGHTLNEKEIRDVIVFIRSFAPPDERTAK